MPKVFRVKEMTFIFWKKYGELCKECFLEFWDITGMYSNLSRRKLQIYKLSVLRMGMFAKNRNDYFLASKWHILYFVSGT